MEQNDDFKTRVQRFYDSLDSDMQKDFAAICPELKESEDERIRKKVIEVLKLNIRGAESQMQAIRAVARTFEVYACYKAIAWLEKKDEHIEFLKSIQIGDEVTRNPDGVLVNLSQLKRVAEQDSQNLANSAKTCKVEPKFKVGDWIVYNYDICQIVKREEGCNKLVTNFGIEKELVNERNLSTARPWTIQDAKDGDVLSCENGWTCIFKALDNHTNTFSSYCFIDNDKWFCNTGSECHTLDKAFIKAYNGEIHPATKEQRDLLFQKMKEAGYEWDAEKKEVRKLEQPKLTAFEEAVKDMMDDYRDAIGDDNATIEEIKKHSEYLLSLIPQNPAWSEEDEKRFTRACVFIKNTTLQNVDEVKADLIAWLKALKERCTWKPSDEQMIALKEVCDKHWEPDGLDPLYTLYQDLKKLKG